MCFRLNFWLGFIFSPSQQLLLMFEYDLSHSALSNSVLSPSMVPFHRALILWLICSSLAFGLHLSLHRLVVCISTSKDIYKTPVQAEVKGGEKYSAQKFE